MDVLTPAAPGALFQTITIVDLVVLGGLTSAIVSLLVLVVIYGDRRSAQRARAKAKRVKGPPPQAVVQQPVKRATADPEDDITLIRMSFEELQKEEQEAKAAAEAAAAAQRHAQAVQQQQHAVGREDDIDRAIPIVMDPGAEDDEPTRNAPMILVSAAAQSDRGRKRERNEDRFAVYEQEHLYVVADGMGGYAGGQIASQLCCDTIVDAFREGELQADWKNADDAGVGAVEPNIPKRAAELAVAIQMANRAIFHRGQEEQELRGMGTTVVCARFAPKKRRLYVGHVGDSRCYRIRDNAMQQLTEDHTMARFGVTGRHGAALSRAVGIGPGVNVDLVICEPRVDDVYLLCSDGLTKMVKDEAEIRDVVLGNRNLESAVNQLVAMANDRGGKDNVTVVLVAVRDASGLRKGYSLTPVSAPRVGEG